MVKIEIEFYEIEVKMLIEKELLDQDMKKGNIKKIEEEIKNRIESGIEIAVKKISVRVV